MPYSLAPLPYDYSALESYIDAQTMSLHHDKHHATYTQKLNDALKNTKWEQKSAEWLLAHLDQLPENLKQPVKNFGGGFVNHNLFWQCLSPKFDQQPSSALLKAINQSFGSYQSFQDKFSQAAMTQFGSGWAWLVQKPDGSLGVYSLPNQDTPLTIGDTPLLTVDVWEHAYYLKYQNRRDEYIANFWHVVDWQKVASRLKY